MQLDQGRFDEAEPLLRESLALRRSSLDEDHPTLAAVEVLLGRCLVGRRQYDEAESLLLRGHEVLKKGVGDENDRTQIAVRGLIDLYMAWGKTDQADRWTALRTGTAD